MSGKLQYTVLSVYCISKFSSGQISYYPNFHVSNLTIKRKFEQNLQHYLTRRIGFEAVMRIRCTQGYQLCMNYTKYMVATYICGYNR